MSRSLLFHSTKKSEQKNAIRLKTNREQQIMI